MSFRRPAALVLLAAGLGTAALAGGLLRSGPQPGERPLPFTSNMVSGPQRGKQFCYVCELKDEPAVLVFARRTDDTTGRLMRSLRDAVREHREQKLFAWFVFLGPQDSAGQLALERQAYEFARGNGATALPVSALGEPLGPPGYVIAPDADVTVLLFRSGKVRVNRAYRQRDWNNKAVDQILKDLPALLAAR